MLLPPAPLGPNIFLSNLFSRTLNLCFNISVRPSFITIQNNRQNYSTIYFNSLIGKNNSKIRARKKTKEKKRKNEKVANEKKGKKM